MEYFLNHFEAARRSVYAMLCLCAMLVEQVVLTGCSKDDKEDERLEVSPENLQLDDNGEGTLTITSNTKWEVSTTADWLSFSTMSGVGGGQVSVYATGKSPTERIAIASVRSNGIGRQVLVVQPAAPIIVVPKKVIIWKNNGSYGETAWSGEYRFCLEGTDSHSECIAELSKDFWDKIKYETFYVTIKGTDFMIYFSSGWWAYIWTNDLIYPDSNLLEPIGDNLYTLSVNLAGDPLVDVIDEQHLLFTGQGYSVEEIYYIEKVEVLG